VELTTYEEGLQEQFAWLYGHKSEYGLMLVLCVAFCVVYRKHFQNIFTYVLSLGVLFMALYISDSYTAMGVSMLIFVGQFLDYLCKTKEWKKLVAMVIIPLPLIFLVKVFLQRLGDNREISTLGGRTYIWKYFIEYNKTHPNGTLEIFGSTSHYIAEWATVNKWGEWGSYANNAHNVFINHMFRFSVLVGNFFITLCIMIVLFSIIKNLSFTTICIWIALFIPMMMDNSLTSIELSYVLVLVFIIFFRNPKKRNSG